MEIEVKKVRAGAVIPKYAKAGDAGVDLHACIDAPILVAPGQTIMVPTGIAIHINNEEAVCMLHPRSGLGSRDGIVLGNLTGVVDSGYQNEVMVAVWNRNQNGEAFIISPGMRIAQAVFLPILRVTFKEVEDFSAASERGMGGFGSTGV